MKDNSDPIILGCLFSVDCLTKKLLMECNNPENQPDIG